MKTKYIVLITLLISIFTSCKNAEELHDVIYFTGTETSPAVAYTINGPAELGVTVTSSCLAPTDQKISIKANPELVAIYNSLNTKRIIKPFLKRTINYHKTKLYWKLGKRVRTTYFISIEYRRI